MTIAEIDSFLRSGRSWPSEEPDELIDLARVIEARRQGVYDMSAAERSAVEEGRGQASRGEFVPDEEMKAFWTRLAG